MARKPPHPSSALAERAWPAIERFYRNSKAKVSGKKGYPKFKKYQVWASVEYKTSGWKRCGQNPLVKKDPL